MLALQCSPRADGVTDTLIRIFVKSYQRNGAKTRALALRDYNILPCTGCNVCLRANHCPLYKKDDTELIFNAILNSKLLVIATPIYFYALPAHFKALIDRSQKYWHKDGNYTKIENKTRKVVVIMTAGRSRGASLFKGALLSLKWFLKPFASEINDIITLRGLNDCSDLLKFPEYENKISLLGQKWSNLNLI